jgi:hypothetical protein
MDPDKSTEQVLPGSEAGEGGGEEQMGEMTQTKWINE